MKKLLFLWLALLGFHPVWARPVFSITPILSGQSQLVQGQQGTAIYQVSNNSQFTLSNVNFYQLPTGVSAVTNAGYQYCSFPISLTSGSSCIIKVNMNSNQTASVQSGPVLCYTPSHPVYCSQPYQPDQLAMQTIAGPVPSTCTGNEANFNYELSQTFDSTTIDPTTINSWGPARNQLTLSPANPNLTGCTTTDITNTNAIQWMQTRVIDAESLWVGQKLSYCHHHVPDFATPALSYGTPRSQIGGSDGGYCSPQIDIMPGSPYYNQQARWNYSGNNSETIDNWINNNGMWYGVDCSDFTSFIYNFAFGIQFNSDTGFQAGQATDHSQDNLTPNGQTALKVLQPFSNSNPNSPAGVLVCTTGQTENELPECGGYGTNGYMSSFLNSDTSPTYSAVTDEMLTKLQPGDLIFLGFVSGDGNNTTSLVTHVITWTGQKIGYGSNDVNPSQIAPEEICPTDWQPQIGQWVIIDSHYQGPDYRMFTTCFYQHNIWGVRRVIGYMQ